MLHRAAPRTYRPLRRPAYRRTQQHGCHRVASGGGAFPLVQPKCLGEAECIRALIPFDARTPATVHIHTHTQHRLHLSGLRPWLHPVWFAILSERHYRRHGCRLSDTDARQQHTISTAERIFVPPVSPVSRSVCQARYPDRQTHDCTIQVKADVTIAAVTGVSRSTLRKTGLLSCTDPSYVLVEVVASPSQRAFQPAGPSCRPEA